MDFGNGNARIRMEGDRLSSLPDGIIHLILSFNDIKYAVQTSVLSSRWKLIWTTLPYLKFSTLVFSTRIYQKLQRFSMFVDRVLLCRNNQTEVSAIDIHFMGAAKKQIVNKIANYAVSHNVQKVRILNYKSNDCEDPLLPLCLFSSQSLKDLYVRCRAGNHSYSLPQSPWDSPVLTTIELNDLWLCAENTMCLDLFSKCVNLMNLTLIKCKSLGLKLMKIACPRLVHLTISHCQHASTYEILTPNLISFCYEGFNTPLLSTTGLSFLEEVNLDIYIVGRIQKNRDEIRRKAHDYMNMLQNLRNASSVTLSGTVIVLLSKVLDLPEHQPSPFCNLKYLSVEGVRTSRYCSESDLTSQVTNYLWSNSRTVTSSIELPKEKVDDAEGEWPCDDQDYSSMQDRVYRVFTDNIHADESDTGHYTYIQSSSSSANSWTPDYDAGTSIGNFDNEGYNSSWHKWNIKEEVIAQLITLEQECPRFFDGFYRASAARAIHNLKLIAKIWGILSSNQLKAQSGKQLKNMETELAAMADFICVEVMITNFFKKRPLGGETSNEQVPPPPPPPSQPQGPQPWNGNLNDLEADPGWRTPIEELAPTSKQREDVRRMYLARGPSRPPTGHNFPYSFIGDKRRRFCPDWYNFGPKWLEYSVAKDEVYCLSCYLFKCEVVDNGNQGSGDTFVGTGFKNWKDKNRLKKHTGSSIHKQCHAMCLDFMNRDQHIDICFDKGDKLQDKAYEVRLRATIDVVRVCLRYGLPFRGHDESKDSNRKGIFLGLLEFLAEQNEAARPYILNENQYFNCISPKIQKAVTSACSYLTSKLIIDELVNGNEPFSLLVDESRDVSVKEQMAIVVRYVNKEGRIIESFLGVVHVSSTTAHSLKTAIDAFFAKHGLSMSRLRGQGYDGASNMSGRMNGLKTLILNENKSAYYVHCFAHQLQLALIGAVKNHGYIGDFFESLSSLANTVGASCSRKDLLRVKHAEKVIELIASDDIETGTGLNQETTIKRPGETRWGSHYGTIVSVIKLLPSVIDVLRVIEVSGPSDAKQRATNLLRQVETFEYVFVLFLMKSILVITNELCQALQRKDQDIVNAMDFIRMSKKRLNEMRNDEGSFEKIVKDACILCKDCEITFPENMEDLFGVPKRGVERVSNKHRFKVQLMYTVLDYILEELNNRFDEVNMRLLECMSCLNPKNSFGAFDKEKIIEFASFYPSDFCETDIWMLDDELDSYHIDVMSHPEFHELEGISELAQKLVATGKHLSYKNVYLLLKLALLLPVATASVERVFSAMKYVKSELRNKIGDEWMNDCLLLYVEFENFQKISNDDIIRRFQATGNRKKNVKV